jgi:hypothetical protein
MRGGRTSTTRYWNTRRAQERAFWLRDLGTARAIIPHEPRRKGSRGQQEAASFQSDARAQLQIWSSWPRPRAALAVDLMFHTTERQPPKLWHLPKHYLDLLGESDPSTGVAPLLYRDDRQVKMLYASVDHGWNASAPKEGAILIDARTRTNALHVMDLADQLAQREGSPPLGRREDLPYDPYGEEWGLAEEDLRTASALERRGDVESQYIAEVMRHRVRLHRQAGLLDSNDEWLTRVFLGNARRLVTGNDGRDRANQEAATRLGFEPVITPEDQITFARHLLTGLYPIELPPLPNVHGEGSAFRKRVDQICDQYVVAHPGLFPLVVPLQVTVLVVPPDRHHRNSADLDNILIKILAAVDEHMKPPISPWFLGPLPPEGLLIDDQSARTFQQQGRDRARSLGRTSLWAYQIIELARTRQDAAAGQVLLILGHGMNRDSLWSRAFRYVEHWFDATHDDDEVEIV